MFIIGGSGVTPAIRRQVRGGALGARFLSRYLGSSVFQSSEDSPERRGRAEPPGQDGITGGHQGGIAGGVCGDHLVNSYRPPRLCPVCLDPDATVTDNLKETQCNN